MARPLEFYRISSSLLVWQRYDPAVKADLWSTGISLNAENYLVDPIDADLEEIQAHLGGAAVAGVFVTNQNHFRAAASFCSAFSAPLLVHEELVEIAKSLSVAKITRLHHTDTLADGALTIVEIPGAPLGEIAILCGRNGGAIIIGDALINFEPYGFAFLPKKYCANECQMRDSLARLLDYQFEKLLFAHGTPIIRDARRKLEQLLAAAE